MVRVNGRITQVNAARLRLMLTILVVGIVYGTLTSGFVLSGGGAVEWLLLGVVTAAILVVGWYIHTERYIVEQSEQEDTNEYSE